MRCRGMKMSRMPLLVWLYLVMSSLVFVTVSPLTAAQIMLLSTAISAAHFFDTQAGGSAVVWMHFFWIFGHPEVYVLVLPAFAFMRARSFPSSRARPSSVIRRWSRHRSASALSA
jgi:cytochrome c oxidase subunit 1